MDMDRTGLAAMAATPGIVPDGPMAAGDAIAHFLGAVPDGAVIETGPETAGVIESAIRAAGRTITVKAHPYRDPDRLRAWWDGPAWGEHHAVEMWL